MAQVNLEIVLNSNFAERNRMDTTLQDTLFFFDRHQAVYPLYECFQEKLLARFPESRIKVQKSQISYCNRHLYACVSFLKVKKKSELPEDYFVLTLGLSAPLESDRVAAKTEPYPGRWTTHFVISSPGKSRFLQEADGRKGIASAADELCGSALR